MKMNYRPHRGGFAESMALQVELDATYEALAEHLGCKPDELVVNYYGFDERINSGTYLVKVNGDPVGFTNEPVKCA